MKLAGQPGHQLPLAGQQGLFGFAQEQQVDRGGADLLDGGGYPGEQRIPEATS